MNIAFSGNFFACAYETLGALNPISWFEVAMHAIPALARQIDEWHQISGEIVKLLIYPAFT